MSIINQTLRTIKCNNEECNKEITFDIAKERETFDNPANVWLKSIRLVQSLDQRVFAYCSDICEIMGARSGKHNLPEPKKIIEDGSAQAVAAAAQAAEASAQSDKNLKSGSGGPVLVKG